ncbi:MAG: tetratricopeptide repeat protein [Candidatus Hydrogenedentes bacterium]|jgi:tetratricopeptide (TPR) repeat protein|nr:tetratricopeptide repeat protein [Candidatus Hydrogenedentota bacterium]
MKHLAICIALALLCWLVYGSVAQYDFVDYDDNVYLLENERIHEGLTAENVAWAFTTIHHSNWHPLTWLSWMLDVSLFGFSPGVFHAINAILHLTNACLVYALFAALTGARKPSFVVAALFAVHPIHVESVAWISERKDVLSAFFWLLTTLAYVRWTRRPSRGRNGLVATLFIVGLMAKPMLVTLPFTLVLLDFWPLNRLKKWGDLPQRFREKWLLFAAASVSMVVTYAAQQAGGAIRSVSTVPTLTRLQNAVAAYGDYLLHTVWPTNLSPFYPYPNADSLGIQAGAALLPLAAISALAVAQVRRRPYILFGWLWYLGTLLPVIGIVQVGEQGMADRYTYVSLLGVFVAITWTLWEWSEKSPRRLSVLLASLAVACGALTAAAATQAGHWTNSICLFEHALTVTEDNYVAHNNLGFALRKAGRPGAESHFRRALEIKPDNADAHLNLGSALLESGAFGEATDHYLEALRLRPGDATAHANLGASLFAQGQHEEARGAYAQAAILKPKDTEIRIGLGNTYLQLGGYSDAEREYALVLQTQPGSAEIRCNMAVALIEQGRPGEAFLHTGHVLVADPENVNALYNQGVALAKLNDLAAAAAAFSRIIEVDPAHAMAAKNLRRLDNE